MSIDRALELLDYYGDYPPSNVTLALIHLKRDRKTKQKARALDESGAMSELARLSGQIGSSALPVPEYLREMASWATAQLNRPHSDKHGNP